MDSHKNEIESSNNLNQLRYVNLKKLLVIKKVLIYRASGKVWEKFEKM